MFDEFDYSITKVINQPEKVLDDNLTQIYDSVGGFIKSNNIDTIVAPLVVALNKAGMPTTWSCAGHDGDDDTSGYVMIVPRDRVVELAFKANLDKLTWKLYGFPEFIHCYYTNSCNTSKFDLPKGNTTWHRIMYIHWDASDNETRRNIVALLVAILELTITGVEEPIAKFVDANGVQIAKLNNNLVFTSTSTGKLIYVEQHPQQLLHELIKNHVREFSTDDPELKLWIQESAMF